MSEASQTRSVPSDTGGAKGGGDMLRRARLAQGMDIAVLAALIKMPQSKLEALEAERYADLPDATFARVLAKTICRALKIDADPVLAQMPSAGPMALDKVESGLNAPFRDRPGRVDPLDRLWLRHPVTWIVVVLLLGAMAMAFVPTGWLRSLTGSSSSAATASDAETAQSSPAMPGASAQLPLTPVPAVSPARGAAPQSANAIDPAVNAAERAPLGTGEVADSAGGTRSPMPTPAGGAVGDVAGVVQIRAIESTWIQVTDAAGRVIYSRLVPAGETAGVDAAPPMRIRIGNARGTELRVRGQVVDIAPSTKVNVATVDLP